MAATILLRGFMTLGLFVYYVGISAVATELNEPVYTLNNKDYSRYGGSIELEPLERLHVHRRVVRDAADGDPAVTPSNITNFETTSQSNNQEPGYSSTIPTTIVEDTDHNYYTSKIVTNNSFHWIELDNIEQWGGKKVTHKTLSNAHRTASNVALSFTFYFYGHIVKKITVATGGFLYLSEFLHPHLTATQYIAPLMANFDTRIGNASKIHYSDNGTAFVAQWEDVYVQDHVSAGRFDFQAVLFDTGKIVFAYKDVPLDVGSLSSARHPVKVGLSDAFYIDRFTPPRSKVRTIYEYHRVALDVGKISNFSAVILNPKHMCIMIHDCAQCLQAKIGFKCQFCHAAGRCSDGLDRKRQDWLNQGCHKQEYRAVSECPTVPPHMRSTYPSGHPHHTGVPGAPTLPPSYWQQHKSGNQQGGSFPVAAIIAIIVIICIVIGVCGWLLYAYRNPQSSSGLWLIQHRPSQLQLKAKLSKVQFWKRSGEAAADKYEVSMQPDGESVA